MLSVVDDNVSYDIPCYLLIMRTVSLSTGKSRAAFKARLKAVKLGRSMFWRIEWRVVWVLHGTVSGFPAYLVGRFACLRECLYACRYVID